MGKMGKKKERDGDGKSEGVKREREREREKRVFFAGGAMLRTFSLDGRAQGRGRINRGNLILSKCQTSKIKCRQERSPVCRLPFFPVLLLPCSTLL